MASEPSAKLYRARLRRVLAYVDAHLEEPLGTDRLSEVAGFSKFHFHRQFAALHGVTVQRYVHLVRMKRAAYRLAYRADPVIEIALEAGYESPEAFARAFKQRVGQSPTQFRDDPDWSRWTSSYEAVEAARRIHVSEPLSVKIVETQDIPVAVLEHRGDPATLGDSIRAFIAWRRSVGLAPRVSATFNLFYDDPTTTPPEAFRFGLCAATTRAVAANDAGVSASVIPGGRCATFRHVGSDDGFTAALDELYRVWLPASGEELRDFPLYCQRVTFFPDVAEQEAVTEFFLPLK